MAARGLRVTAIDLSPEMIGLARRRTPGALGVTYRAADFMDDARPLGRHDVVVAVNALHHLPLDRAVARMRALVAPGGAVLIQDVLSRPGLRYLLWNLAGGVERLVGRLARARALDAEVAALYEEHGRGETYLTPDEARAAYAARLPGARVLHHAGWRYSVVWRAPG
jgi:SAM-dependent methyltransferase